MNDISISLFGATGSIGNFTLKLIDKLDKKDRPNIFLLSGYSQIKKLIELEEEFKSKYLFIPKSFKDKIFQDLSYSIKKKINILTSFDELFEIYQDIDKSKNFIINGIIGNNGIIPTFISQYFGILCGCANKESVIMAFELFKDFNTKLIYPLDSEHNAIYHLLATCNKDKISKIYITGSGGKVFGKNEQEIENLDLDELIKHPNWNMGKRITVDSSSGINKAFEFIELMALFNIPKEKIEIIIDRKSQVHAILQDINNYYFAAISNPDMQLPISKFFQFIGIDNNYFCKPIKESEINFQLNRHIKNTYPFLDIFIKNYNKNFIEGTIIILLNTYFQDLLFENKINFSKLRMLLINSFNEIFIKNDSHINKDNVKDNIFVEISKITNKLSFKNRQSIKILFESLNNIFNLLIIYLKDRKVLEEMW